MTTARPLASAQQLGSLGRRVRRGRIHGAHARVAGRSRDGGGGTRTPRRLRRQDRGPGRRPLSGRHRQADREADGDRPLLRRAPDPDPRRAWAFGGVGRHRSGALPRRAAAADLGASVGLARASQSRQPAPCGAAHLRAVPVRIRKRGERGRGEGSLRDVRGPGPRRTALPGRDGELQPAYRGQGRQRESRARAASDHLRRRDHTVPPAIANASYKKQQRNSGVTEIVEIPGRGHALTIDSGRREVADTALEFVKRFV
jgi:hypothetical protein